MDQIEHEHYSLKLIPNEEIKYCAGEMVRLEHSRLDFGSFRGILIDPENKWMVLRFDPSSYDTREKDLQSAKEYLFKKGFDSKVFDLEKLVDEV